MPSSEALVILQAYSEISRLLTEQLIDTGVKQSICQLDMLRAGGLETYISLLEAEGPIPSPSWKLSVALATSSSAIPRITLNSAKCLHPSKKICPQSRDAYNVDKDTD